MLHSAQGVLGWYSGPFASMVGAGNLQLLSQSVLTPNMNVFGFQLLLY